MKTRRHAAAFTMVELLIALAIAIVVTAGIYSLYSNYVKAFIAQDRVVETQQKARIALDTLTQDILRAGYKVAATSPAIVHAAGSEITVELFNEQAGVYERIRYYVDGSSNLVREVYRDTGGWTLQPGLSGVLAEQVRFQDLNENSVQDAGEAPALQFSYYTQTAFQASPTAPAALDVSTPRDAANPADVPLLVDIRQVRVTLTARSEQRDPVTGKFVYRTLRADVKPRNAGLMSTIKDNTPPAVPTGLASVDRGDCGLLYVSWNENTEPDLAGYILYYGRQDDPPGGFLNSVTIPVGTPHSAASPFRLSGLADGVQYRLAIAAYDYSGNSSALSAELTGTGGTGDTEPNVADPDSAPANFAGVAGANQVTLSWNKLNEPDIVGYRVYRKTSPFTASDFTAIRANNLGSAGILQIANESMFGPTLDPRVTDTGSGFSLVDSPTATGLKGCVEYYYAVTAIKGCNHPITGYSDSLFATTGPKTPSDTTPPDPAALAAYPSYLRNYLNLTNPSNPDFTHSLIAYRTDGAYPTFSVDPGTGAITTTGTLVECYSSSYGPGSFTAPGTTNILHRGTPCDTAYHLNPAVTYYYTAVAVDTCKNLSDYSQAQSQVAATQCSDETEGPGVGNPPKVTGIHGNTGRTSIAVTTSDATLGWTPIDDSFTAIRDFAGYYIFRTSGDTTATPQPALGNIDNAKGLILSPSVVYSGLTEGKINRVRVLGVDCETVTKDDAGHTFLASRYPPAEFDSRASDTLIFYPGTLLLDTAVATRALGKQYNRVEFQTKTTINAAATPASSDKIEFKTLTFDWTTPNSGAGSDRLLKSVTIKNGTTTFTITPTSPVASKTPLSAAGTGFRGGTNATFELEFINSSTGDASKADMRRLRIDATVVYIPVTRLNSDTAPPFVFDATQTAQVSFSVPATRGPEITEVYDANSSSPVWYPAVAWPSAGRLYPSTEAIDFLVRVEDNSGRGIDRLRVFYAVTPKTTTTPPTLGTDFPATISPSYLSATICDSDPSTLPGSCSGSGYYAAFGLVPPQSGQRVWYFVLVEDKTGNYGVSPVQDTTTSNVTYTYDQ